jgi:1-acyl-sn-glycerol-3-phosphate acyltransferase
MLYGVIKAVLSPIFRVTFRVQVSGLENVPPSGGVIIASNHQAFCDSLFLPFTVPRRVTYVAKAEYFEARRTRWFFRAVGQIPMERSGGAASQKALGEALQVLAAGGCIGIYPEGTRPPDERLHRGRTGVARLALDSRCAVVPAGIKGTRAIQPVGARMLRPFKPVDIAFGKPIDLHAHYGDRLDDPLVLRQATDEIMWEIGQLSGQEYVDKYASRSAQAAEERVTAEASH